MKLAVRGRLWKIGLSLSAVALVFFTVQTVQPLVNNTGASGHQESSWIGAIPAHAQAADGASIYMTRCLSCHQASGLGVSGAFPPLDESEWVTGDPCCRLVRVILHGLMGEIEVNGVVYYGAMPPWGSFLNDEEVAALSTYIRQSWTNSASTVTPAQVAKIREATKDRSMPWEAADFEDEANLGIPGEE